jgi:hypothetical protein
VWERAGWLGHILGEQKELEDDEKMNVGGVEEAQ